MPSTSPQAVAHRARQQSGSSIVGGSTPPAGYLNRHRRRAGKAIARSARIRSDAGRAALQKQLASIEDRTKRINAFTIAALLHNKECEVVSRHPWVPTFARYGFRAMVRVFALWVKLSGQREG